MADVRFVDVLCEYRSQFRLLAMVSVLSILVLSVSLLYVDPGTATFVVAVIQLVTFGAILLVSGGLMFVCSRRTQ